MRSFHIYFWIDFNLAKIYIKVRSDCVSQLVFGLIEISNFLFSMGFELLNLE